jgi:hypothetical protein
MLFVEGIINHLHVLCKIQYAFDGFQKMIIVKSSKKVSSLKLESNRPWCFYDEVSIENLNECETIRILYEILNTRLI